MEAENAASVEEFLAWRIFMLKLEKGAGTVADLIRWNGLLRLHIEGFNRRGNLYESSG